MFHLSCIRSIAEKNLTEQKGAIPPDFGQSPTTLLVVKSGKNNYDKYLTKNFRSYKGLFVILEEKELKNTPYSDSVIYRYLFDYNYVNHYMRGSRSGINVKRYFVYDRLKDKTYEANLTSSFYSALMKAYIHNLNEKLKERQ